MIYLADIRIVSYALTTKDNYQPKKEKIMTEYSKRFCQRVTKEQKKHLTDVRTRTGVDINAQIMQLIQKAMEESKGSANEVV